MSLIFSWCHFFSLFIFYSTSWQSVSRMFLVYTHFFNILLLYSNLSFINFGNPLWKKRNIKNKEKNGTNNAPYKINFRHFLWNLTADDKKKSIQRMDQREKNYNYCFSIKFLFAYGTAHILQEIGHNDNTYCNSSFVIFYSQINSSIRPLHLLFFFVIFFLRDVIFYSVYYIVCSLYFLMNSYSFR